MVRRFTFFYSLIQIPAVYYIYFNAQFSTLVFNFSKPHLTVNYIFLQDYAQCRFDAYFKQKKLFSWNPPC